MREILFRGKRLDNGKWIEGSLWTYLGEPNILTEVNIVGYNVYPETVGQYTGLKDRNGKRIFEGDILRRIYWDGGLSDYTCEMKFGEFNCSCCDGVYGWHLKDGDIREFDTNTALGEMPPYVIAGNIHDNPELLGGNEDG